MKKKTVCFRVVSLVILLAIMLALSASVSAQTSIEDARKSVVRIVALETGWENMRFPAFSVASGFIVGEQAPFEYVATAWHVVDPARIGAESVDIFIYRSRDDLVPARVHVALEVVDIVLLRLDPAHLLHGYEPLYIGRREMASVGDEVFAIGFPAAADVALTDIPAAFYTNATVTRGIISRLTTVAGVAYYQMDASVSPGNSGGPLLNADGQIIGVVTLTAGAEGIHGAAQIDYLTDVLISRGIPYKIAEVIQPPVAPEPVAPEPVATPPVNESPGVNFLYIGLGAVALMLIVLAVVITGRGKKPVVVSAASAAAPRVLPAQAQSAPATMAKPEAAAAVTQARRLQPRPVIKGISGQFAGQTLELVRGQLIIGRDPKVAQVVYPQSSEDISRKHCTVRFDEESKKFMLEDSSSNGTFLASNQKLEPGKPYFLNPGDRFYVADPKEIFEVKLD